MSMKTIPQLNLPLGLAKPDTSLDENTQAELVEELANLIFLFWETANDAENISEEKVNE
jgi:hypothetical protein